MHGDLAGDSVADAAELAGEDVAVVVGGEETAPVAGGAWTGAEVLCCFVVGLGCFVEPSMKEEINKYYDIGVMRWR